MFQGRNPSWLTTPMTLRRCTLIAPITPRRYTLITPMRFACVVAHRFQSSTQYPRPLFRTLHGLLRYQRSSTLFRLVCPSLFCRSVWQANPIACASFPASPSLFVDRSDSKLRYRSGCRAAALTSSSTLAVRQSFRQLFTHAERTPGLTSSLTAESPTIRSL
jgi:hypothetical protein